MSNILEETIYRFIGLANANDAEDFKLAKIVKSKDEKIKTPGKKTCARKNRLPLRSAKGRRRAG